MNKQSSSTTIDYMLIFLILSLGIISIFSLYSIQPILPEKYASINFPIQQLQWYIVGGVVIAFVMFIDYDRFREITWYVYGVSIIPLVMIFFRVPANLIVEFNDAARGIKFPLLGTVQPAEYMKVVLVLTIAHVMMKHNEKHMEGTVKSDFILISKIVAVAAVPMGFIAIQPDLGSVLVLSAITGSMILVSGIKWRLLLSIILASFSSVALLIGVWYISPGPIATFLEDSVFKHVMSRFNGWLNPEQYLDSGYQLILTKLAIGSGQFSGKGLSHMEVYVPERHTDMIFTAIAEQFGFIGSSILLITFFLLIYRLIHIAILSNDQYGSYLVTGFVGMFAYQIFQNIGMSIQLLPITGLPLPFISYGGSSTLTYMLAIAIVLNVHSRTKTYMFDS